MSKRPLVDMDKSELIAELERFRQLEVLFGATEHVAKIGHYEWDYTEDKLSSCSQEYASLFGMTIAEVMESQSSWEKTLEQIHPEDYGIYRKAAESMPDAQALDVEYRVLRKDGEVRHVHEVSVVVFDKSNNKIGSFGILQDVTEQEKYKRDLEYRDMLAVQAEEITDIGYFIFDLVKETYDYISPGFARIHGVTCDEYMQRVTSREDDMSDVYEEDYERLANVYLQHREQGTNFSVDYRIYRADGAIRWIREVSRVHTIADGEIQQSIGVLQDITESAENERALEYRDALSQQAESITDIGHFIYDEEGEQYLYVSPGCARIHGQTVEEFMRRQSIASDIEDIHEDDRERVAAEYRRSVETGEECAVEYRIIRPDGKQRWLRELGKAHKMKDGRISQTMGVMQDITPQKEAEAQMLAAKDELEAKVDQRTRELAETVKKLKEEISEREKVSAELKFLANHDALTGLPSLRLCKDRLERSLIESRRSNLMSAVVFVDLDGFKTINDTYGHEFGDVVLKVTAGRIRAEIRETDTVARIGGDEFVVIITGVPDLEVIERVAANIVEQVGQAIQLNQQQIHVGASLGIALYPEDGNTPEELIRQADSAMYRIKNSGKNNYGFTGTNRLN